MSDTTDSTTFVVFDKKAEQLTGKTAKELADMQDEVMKHKIFTLLLQNKIKCIYNLL